MKFYTRILKSKIPSHVVHFSVVSHRPRHTQTPFGPRSLRTDYELICMGGVPHCRSVAARSKAWVCGQSLAGIAGSNPAGGMKSLVSVVCCRVEVSATS